jgi:hypothetical protein
MLTVASSSHPKFDVCKMRVRTANGLQGTLPGSPNTCENEKDGYMNSQPTALEFDFHFTFTYTVSQSRPQYIDSSYKFGVVAASAYQRVLSATGQYNH